MLSGIFHVDEEVATSNTSLEDDSKAAVGG